MIDGMPSRADSTRPPPRLPEGWTLDAAGDILRIRSTVACDAPALAGWRLRHVEDDLCSRLLTPAPSQPTASNYVTEPWSEARAEAAYAAYVASFEERPGFPGWSCTRWLDWATGYASFRGDLSRVVLEGSEIVGYALAAQEPDGCHIVQMGVVPAARRRGLGRTLLRLVAVAAATEGTRELRLAVNLDNPGARALYASEGYRFSARRAVYEASQAPRAP